ncbi:M28 family peptidase [Geodermatophilus nigrescens]
MTKAAVPARADLSSFDRAVDELSAAGYPREVVDTLNGFGDNALGFRLAGSPAEHEAADYLAGEFRAMGISDVRKEPVPVDAWTLRGAEVQIGDRALTASQFPGVPGTDGPLTAEIVFAGRGTAADFQDQDVQGKLVLIDRADELHIEYPGHEAQLRGAIGIVFTAEASSVPAHVDPGALQTDEVRWRVDGLPAVFVSARDGQWIKSGLHDGPLQATVTSDVEIAMHDFADVGNGGVGYNVVAEIAGTDPDAQAILIAAHYDAFFRSALDNTGPVAQMMTIAKAMMTSGTRYERPVIFLASCGEEYGYADTEYSYLAGAWWAATVTHASSAADPAERWTGPDGRVGLFLNLEESPQTGAPLSAGATPDLLPWFSAIGEKWAGELLPNGFGVHRPYSVWHDGATFAFAGIPTVVTVAENADYADFNHSTQDDVALIDYDYLGQLVKFYDRVLSAASTGVAPHDLAAQCSAVHEALAGTDLTAVGADPQTVAAVTAALERYGTAVAAYTARRDGIPAHRRPEVNRRLSALQSHWYRNLSGVDAYDRYWLLSFQQTVHDITHLRAAIEHLEDGTVDAAAAIAELEEVSRTRLGLAFSPEVHRSVLRRYLPDYPMLTWGGQINQAWHPDITAEVRQVQAGEVEKAIGGLKTVLTRAIEGVDVPGAQSATVHIDGLNERLAHVAAILTEVTPWVDELA